MKVSAIMPTYDRRHLIPLALRSYLAQDWPEKELIVIDDGTDEVRDLFTGIESCVYIRVADRMSIGAKRNLACEVASGAIICHWDDDDWSASTRISRQVRCLLESGKSVTGYHSLLFWCGASGKTSEYRNRDTTYCCGTSLCYYKSWWAAHPFKSIDHGEDGEFVRLAKKASVSLSVEPEGAMVARIHPQCVSKRYGGSYPAVPATALPAEFLAAVGL